MRNKIKLRWFFAFLLLGSMAIYWLPDFLSRPVNHIKINAQYKHIQPQEIQQVVIPLINKGFFTVNVAKIQAEVKKLSWVSGVGVRRIWPDTILITIKEHRALARWKAGGVFDQDGELFHPDMTNLPQDLPVLEGPETLSKKIFEGLQQVEPYFAKNNLAIKSILVSDRGSWTIKLNSNTDIVLGKENHLERVDRLMSAWSTINKKHKTPIKRIDLRYPNGFAVR